jgi:hypothetical protein
MCVLSQDASKDLLMLLAAGYFDESTDGEFEERVFSVGGYIADGYSALQLDYKWKELLDKHGLVYFKASEADAGIEQFAKFRDNPSSVHTARFTEREKKILTDIKIEFVDLLCEQPHLIGVSATLHMQNWRAFANDYPGLAKRLPPVYQLCGHLVLMASGFIMNRSNEGRPAHLQGILKPVFDSHQEYADRFIASFDGFREKNPECSRNLLPPIFENDTTYKCLQAADLFVYEIRRTISNHFFDPRRDLRIAMGRLFPHVENTFVLDYEALKSLAEWQGRDKIPIEPL